MGAIRLAAGNASRTERHALTKAKYGGDRNENPRAGCVQNKLKQEPLKFDRLKSSTCATCHAARQIHRSCAARGTR